MTEKANKPSIRFKGFTDAWEQRKIDEVVLRIATGLNPRDNFTLNCVGKNFYVTIKNFEHGHLYLDDRCDKVDDKALELIQERSDLQIGDILFTSIGRIGDCFLIKNTPKNWNINESVFTLRPNRRFVESEYLFHTIHSEKVLNQILSNITGSTFKSIKIADLKKAVIPIPPKQEQRKLSTYISTFDNLITLHQRKYDKLVNVKKSLLEKMFPSGDENFPKIRFKGFTDAWELRKLGEVVERVVRKNTNNESTLPLTISAQYGLVDQITYFNNRVASRDVSNYYLVLNGEFAYNKSTSDGHPFGAVKRLDLYEKGVLSTLYIVFALKDSSTINSDFLAIFFDTDRWHKGVAEKAEEGARNHGLLNITPVDFFYIDVKIPKEEREQCKIGTFFHTLDNLITLHQRKLEKLKNIKKALLDKMFV